MMRRRQSPLATAAGRVSREPVMPTVSVDWRGVGADELRMVAFVSRADVPGRRLRETSMGRSAVSRWVRSCLRSMVDTVARFELWRMNLALFMAISFGYSVDALWFPTLYH